MAALCIFVQCKQQNWDGNPESLVLEPELFATICARKFHHDDLCLGNDPGNSGEKMTKRESGQFQGTRGVTCNSGDSLGWTQPVGSSLIGRQNTLQADAGKFSAAFI